MYLLRVLFIVLFVFCHFANTNEFPYVDMIYGVKVLKFLLSCGGDGSLNVTPAPRRVHVRLSNTIGTLMTTVC